MTEENKTQKSTSKVIDSLHSQIDELKSELEHLKISQNDDKKRNTILSTKNDSLVDQLANYKHENDMINALLKRKERRVADLEVEFDSLSSESESLKLSVKNYKVRCDNLQESLASSAAELERLKIAYDAIVAAQSEYKNHYQEEVANLTLEFANYKKKSAEQYKELTNKIESNDKDVDVLVDSLTSKTKALDSIYVSRNKTVLEFLGQLARAAKAHGEESRSILRENVEIINLLRDKYPELQDLISECSETSVDLDSILGDSSVCLDSDFADVSMNLATSDDSHSSNLSRNKSKKNRQRKTSSRASPELTDGLFLDMLPKARNSLRSGSRNFSRESAGESRLLATQTRSASIDGDNLRVSSGGSKNSYGGHGNYGNQGNLGKHGNHTNSHVDANKNNIRSNSSGPSTHKYTSLQLQTPRNVVRGKKAGLSQLLSQSTQSNKNYKRKLFHGGSIHFNINNHELTGLKVTGDAA